jgi:thioredoxin reductase (NADPH)
MGMLDLIVVGGGPAGLAAGIQAQHMRLKVKVLEQEAWGGRLRLARRVENFPGLTEPLNGQQVAEKMFAQALNKGVPLSLDACELIDHHRWFEVETPLRRYLAKAVIIATGVEPLSLDIPGSEAFQDRVFYSWRDLPRSEGMRIAVIGGGEAAFDQACSLAERGAVVTLLIRGSKPRAFSGLVQDAQRLGVKIVCRAEVKGGAVKGADLSLRLYEGDNTTHDVDCLLIAVGSRPTEINITEAAAAREGLGLYWAGDVCAGRYRQAAIAFGDGIRKAMIVYEYLQEVG